MSARARLAGISVPARAATAAVVCGLLAAGVSGCGSSDPHAVRDVKQTVRAALAAVAADDGRAFCALATPSAQRMLAATDPGSGCVAVVDRLGAQLSPQVKLGMRTAVVRGVTVHGDRAIVRAADITSSQGVLSGYLQPDSPPTILARQRDGRWKLAG